MKDKTNKNKGLLYGIVIGDMLGVPYEFESRGVMKNNPCTEYTIGGYHDQPIYSWSDDTSLNLALIDSLLKNNLIVNKSDILKRYKLWLYESKYTSHGVVFDVGVGTRIAINNQDIDQTEFQGNGGLIRSLSVLPLDNRLDNVSAISDILNNNYTTRAINVNLVFIYKMLLECNNSDELRDMFYTHKKCINDEYFNLLETKEDDVKSSGYIIDTFKASIWCILHSKSFKEAVLKAVNLGDDTDSVGAVTGALAGCLYGFDNIPNEFKGKALQNKELDVIEEYLEEIKNIDKYKLI